MVAGIWGRRVRCAAATTLAAIRITASVNRPLQPVRETRFPSRLDVIRFPLPTQRNRSPSRSCNKHQSVRRNVGLQRSGRSAVGVIGVCDDSPSRSSLTIGFCSRLHSNARLCVGCVSCKLSDSCDGRFGRGHQVATVVTGIRLWCDLPPELFRVSWPSHPPTTFLPKSPRTRSAERQGSARHSSRRSLRIPPETGHPVGARGRCRSGARTHQRLIR